MDIYHDEKIHNKTKYKKYQKKYCKKCDQLEQEDCYYRRTIYEKKMCLLKKYENEKKLR